ncbi:MAG: hypothetical protein ABEJ74_03390 [Haloferacaceae archaeon]
MAASTDGDAPDNPLSASEEWNRRRATLAVLPFLALGLADILLLLFWGLEPLWGFVILLPILFCAVLAYIVFASGFDNQGLARDADR